MAAFQVGPPVWQATRAGNGLFGAACRRRRRDVFAAFPVLCVDRREIDPLDSVDAEPVRPGPRSRCRRCGAMFRREDNYWGACRFHASVIGNRGYFHQFVQTVHDPESKKLRQRKVYRWSCCDAREKDSLGCRLGRHLTFDDEDERFSDDWSNPYGVSGYGFKELK